MLSILDFFKGIATTLSAISTVASVFGGTRPSYNQPMSNNMYMADQVVSDNYRLNAQMDQLVEWAKNRCNNCPFRKKAIAQGVIPATAVEAPVPIEFQAFTPSRVPMANPMPQIPMQQGGYNPYMVNDSFNYQPEPMMTRRTFAFGTPIQQPAMNNGYQPMPQQSQYAYGWGAPVQNWQPQPPYQNTNWQQTQGDWYTGYDYYPYGNNNNQSPWMNSNQQPPRSPMMFNSDAVYHRGISDCLSPYDDNRWRHMDDNWYGNDPNNWRMKNLEMNKGYTPFMDSFLKRFEQRMTVPVENAMPSININIDKSAFTDGFATRSPINVDTKDIIEAT